jgi:hypothetical protein
MRVISKIILCSGKGVLERAFREEERGRVRVIRGGGFMEGGGQ